jgi:hypothetical protein
VNLPRILPKANGKGEKQKKKRTMPQLDTTTFLPQVFWLIVVFFIFYVLVLQFILPKLSTILKVRSKKLSQGQNILGEMSSETNELGVVYDNILITSLKESERLIQLSTTGTFSWVDSTSNAVPASRDSVGRLSIRDLRGGINSYYLKSIGKISSKKGILRRIVSSPKILKALC